MVRAFVVAVLATQVSATPNCDSQGYAQCEDASMLQVSHKASVAAAYWKLTSIGQTCDSACGDDSCDAETMANLLEFDTSGQARMITALASLGKSCFGDVVMFSHLDGAPFVTETGEEDSVNCYALFTDQTPTCSSVDQAVIDKDAQSLCRCEPAGGANGDPHISTFRGAHYTVFSQGKFLAWSFKDKSVDLELIAFHDGRKAWIQGLLLKEKQSGLTMELTPNDCLWRAKEGNAWRPVKSESISSAGHAIHFKVVESQEADVAKGKWKGAIDVSMTNATGEHQLTHLRSLCWTGHTSFNPHKHSQINYKLFMFDRKDIAAIGGELSSEPKAQLSQANPGGHGSWTSKYGVEKRDDANFQVQGSWTELGGSEAGARFLATKEGDEAVLVGDLAAMAPCDEAAEEEAAKLCRKHLKQPSQSSLANCVFDVCNGDAEDAVRASELIAD